MESYIENLKDYSTELISIGVVFAFFLLAGQILKWVFIRIGKSNNPSTFKIYIEYCVNYPGNRNGIGNTGN